MKPKSFAPKTPVQSDFTAQRQSIGFKPSAQLPAVIDVSSEPVSPFARQYAEMEEIVLQLANTFFEKKSNGCFVDGANKELIEKMHKVWVKFYDTIV